jgi:hypothetical protein
MGRSSLVVLAMVSVLGSALPTTSLANHRPTSLQVVGTLNSGKKIEVAEYSVRQLRDLTIVAWWNVPGTHVQRLELRAPDGSVYQRLTRTFTTDSSPHVTGDGRARGTAVRTLVPVGGTWIREYSLVGTWQINLYMDRSRTPIASYALVLTP